MEERIKKEYNRVKKIFADSDENLIKLLEGTIWEFARIKIELEDLHEIVKESGLIKIHPENPTMQKELPVAKVIVKNRANYLNYAAKLAAILGINEEDDDLGLDAFE